jgi:hypothetical protein
MDGQDAVSPQQNTCFPLNYRLSEVISLINMNVQSNGKDELTLEKYLNIICNPIHCKKGYRFSRSQPGCH